ncbi:MAG: DUF502 domain-containing protein [Pseudomonadota bacterium]
MTSSPKSSRKSKNKPGQPSVEPAQAAAAPQRSAPAPSGADLAERLRKLAENDGSTGSRFGSRLRTYFLTGLIIVGPLTITLYIVWSFVSLADVWIKPLVPTSYLPETYLPFAVPGIGLLVGIVGLTVIGALAANLLGRSLISTGEMILERMPIVRNLYGALKQVFEGVLTTASKTNSFQKVGLMEFPSKGIWSLVFITNEAAHHMTAVTPDGQDDLMAVFMPTGVVPPTGFICFVPRTKIILLDLSAEDAAKIIISGGMVIPDSPDSIRQALEAAQSSVVEAPATVTESAPEKV